MVLGRTYSASFCAIASAPIARRFRSRPISESYDRRTRHSTEHPRASRSPRVETSTRPRLSVSSFVGRLNAMNASHLDRQISEDLFHVGADRCVSVSVRDILHVFRTLEELNDVLHRADIGPIDTFNTWRTAIYPFLRDAYYKRCWDMLPDDIRSYIENPAQQDHSS